MFPPPDHSFRTDTKVADNIGAGWQWLQMELACANCGVPIEQALLSYALMKESERAFAIARLIS